jgi:hypothetical protein
MISKAYDRGAKRFVSLGERFVSLLLLLALIGAQSETHRSPPSGAVLRCLLEGLILRRDAQHRLSRGIEATKASVAFASLERSSTPLRGASERGL